MPDNLYYYRKSNTENAEQYAREHRAEFGHVYEADGVIAQEGYRMAVEERGGCKQHGSEGRADHLHDDRPAESAGAKVHACQDASDKPGVKET